MDLSADINLQVLHQLATQFSGGQLPDYVDIGSLQKKADLSLLPPNAFGDPGTSSFPCHSRDATYLSQLFFHGTHANGEAWDGSLPREKVAERLDEASEFWEILNDVSALKHSVKLASTPRELTNDDYAMAEVHRGKTILRYPVVGPEAVKMSAANFFQHRSRYPYAWRRNVSRHLLEKAAEFTVTSDLPDEQVEYMMKACGFVPAEDHDVAVQLMYRAQVSGQDKAKQGLEKLARAVNDGADTNDRSALCDLVDKVDRNLKLFNKYASGLLMPEEVCFTTGVVKEADLEQHVALATGTIYDMSDVKQAGIEPYAVVSLDLAKELAADDAGNLNLEKAAEILPTLPRDHAVLLDRAFEAVGIPRQDAIASMHVKEAANQGNMNAFSLDEWYKFARDRGDGVHENFRICLQMNHPQRVIPTSADSGQQGLAGQHRV